MPKALYLILFLSLYNLTFGQDDYIKKFGEITTHEIELRECPFDSTADAMILFDVGHSIFYNTNLGFNINFKRHKRIKIFKESAREYSNISIPYYAPKKEKKEIIKKIKAFTYNVINGKIEKKELDPKYIYDETLSENWHQKKFVFPDVQEGSILEYSYEHITPYIFNLVDWEFQTDIPTQYSQYKVNMVPYYEYVSIAQKIDNFDINTSEESQHITESYRGGYREQIQTYALKNIEAFKDESFITTKNDFIKKIDFQLSKIHHGDGMKEDVLKTWESLRKKLMDHNNFGGYMRRCRGIAKNILENELVLEGLDDNHKVDRIIDYIKDHFHFNGNKSKYTKQTPREFFNSKSGNVAEINLFLNTLLSESGIEVYPMILSTRKHGKIKTMYPLDASTNYVAVLLKKEKHLVDATQATLDNKLIPPNCINDLGLIIDDTPKDQWMRIHYGKASIKYYQINMKLNPEELTASTRFLCKNMMFEADYYRRKWGNSISEIEDYYQDTYNDMQKININGDQDRSGPYTYSFIASTEIEELGDYLVFNPLKDISWSKNPFINETRSYPVDFTYATQNIYKVNIFIPDNYEPVTPNKNIMVDNTNVRLTYKYEYNEKLRVINLVASYKFKKPIYTADDYKSLRENTQKIIETMNEKITLTKNQDFTSSK